ncbi:hypothetical protein F441_22506 [Phytophthora nicotianae CJ01A1]|uniref:Uncharacterized protein n=2 Tax=Phytophthora nicotianae TaxID=4792 RepID=W2VNZ2_PHYNI|nr:hypothetical protein F441_22506 [Phytophthora nicotianae CJ01A1]
MEAHWDKQGKHTRVFYFSLRPQLVRRFPVELKPKSLERQQLLKVMC